MFRTLRVQFILSHTLPIALLVPLLSVSLLYLLQTRYFLALLSEDLMGQAHMLANVVRQEQTFWQDSAAAQHYIETISAEMTARVMFIDNSGRIYVVTPGDGVRKGDPLKLDIVDAALNGAPAWRTRYSPTVHDSVIDVAAPVINQNGDLAGVVRLSERLAVVRKRMYPLTWYILLISSLGILAALALALFLARAVGIPLLRVTRAVATLQVDPTTAQVVEQGPDELRQLAATFNRMAAKLAEQRGLRRRILASIVHEMSRPLGGINAAAQYLMQHSDSVSQTVVKELSGEIVEQVGQMARQIDDLALLPDAQDAPIALNLNPQEVSLAAICQEELHRIHLLAAEKAIKLTLVTGPETPTIYADKRRVEQIIGNLLNNAVKFSPTGGQIDVAIYPVTDAANAPAVELSVRDSGPGIDPTQQAAIFEPFYRNPEQRPLQQGLGLGLAVALQLAKAHGGDLRVRSTPNEGAIFLLRLPQRPPASAGAPHC